jgi:hypothetical protein
MDAQKMGGGRWPEGSGKLRAGDELPCTIIVKPPFARFEARDYRMTRSGVMFRCMLIW